MHDNDALDQLYESLSPDLKDFSRHAIVEDKLVVEKPYIIRNQTKKFPPLLKPKEKKSASSGRVGVSTKKQKLASEKSKKDRGYNWRVASDKWCHLWYLNGGDIS